MKKDKDILTAYALTIIHNAIPMICFTILAIIFKHWWISLFTMLFWKSYSIKSTDGDK